MSGYRLEGMVLRSVPFGEADRLLTVFSREQGKRRLVARGARKIRSRLAAGSQPFTRSRFLCWRGRTLDGIRQLEVLESFLPLREDLDRYAAAVFVCELLDAVTVEADAQPKLYDLLRATQRQLAETAFPQGGSGEGSDRYGLEILDILVLAYQWKLLALVGFRPQLDRCVRCDESFRLQNDREVRISLAEGGVLCRHHVGASDGVRLVSPGVVGAVKGLIRSPLAVASSLRLSPGDAGGLKGFSRDFLAFVLERRLRSHEFFQDLREQTSMAGMCKEHGRGYGRDGS